MIKANIYILIVSLIVVLLATGCSGRRGPFIDVGANMVTGVADQDWTVSMNRSLGGYQKDFQPRVVYHDKISAIAYPTANLSVGYGITDQFLVSMRAQMGKIIGAGYGLTFFHKSTAPSLFFDAFLGASSYYSDNLPETFYDAADGYIGSIGTGYEWKKGWTGKISLDFGYYDFYADDLNPGDFLATLFTLRDQPVNSINGKILNYYIRFKISYMWY